MATIVSSCHSDVAVIRPSVSVPGLVGADDVGGHAHRPTTDHPSVSSRTSPGTRAVAGDLDQRAAAPDAGVRRQ